MNVLLLSPYVDSSVERTIRRNGDRVFCVDGPVTTETTHRHGSDAIVSYGYRHMIPSDVLASVGRAINLHISLLPHNKGADPNLWSWLNRTPKGVSIHLLTPELDAGHVLAQREVTWKDTSKETLATTYHQLRAEVEGLFAPRWDALRARYYDGVAQSGEGSVHKSSDRAAIWASLPNGWDTPVDLVSEIGDEIRQSARFWDTAA